MALVWGMYRTAYQERTWTDTGVVISDLYRIGLVLLAAAVTGALYSLLLRRLRPWDVAVAALLWWLGLAAGAAVLVPGASYLLTWPLAGGSLGLFGAALLGGGAAVGARAALVALAGAVPGLVLMSSAVHLLLMSAGLQQVVTVVAVWLVAGLLVVPLEVVRRGFRLWLPAALAAAGIVVLMVVGSSVAADAEHPRFTSVHYRVGRSGVARWQATDRLDEWTRSFLRADLRQPYESSYFPQLGMRQTITAAAPQLGLPPPEIRVLEDAAAGGRRTVRLRVRSPRGAPVVSLLVHSVVGRLTAEVAGLPLRGKDTTVLDGTTVRWSFDYYAAPPEGVTVTLRFAAGPPVLLRVVDFSYGVPAELAGRYPGRPGDMLPSRIGDGTLAEATLRLPAVNPPLAP
jgi:hypothetical protein